MSQAGNSVWIRNSQSLDASGITPTLMNAGNINNAAFIATTGTLTIPTTSTSPINVSTGSVNLQGGTDVVGLGGNAVC